MDLRRYAKSQPCMVRYEGCDGGGETTRLAHWRQIGLSGMGIKCNDLAGAFACANCAAITDTDHSDKAQLEFARGIFRTQDELVKRLLVRW